MLRAGERGVVRRMELKDGVIGIQNLTDLVMFCHRLPIVDEKDF